MRAAAGARKKGAPANDKKKFDYAAVAKGEAAAAAAAAAASPTSIAQQRSQWVLQNLVGCEVKVVTKNGTEYEGILQATSVEPSGIAVTLSHARNLAIVSELPTRPERRVKIAAADFALIEATNVTFVHDAADSTFGLNDGFKTDTDISGGQTGAMRELTPWMPDEDVPLPSHLDNTFQKSRGASSGSGSWDQFATNEKLFGVRTTFNEDLYTTVLDKSSPGYKENEQRAQRTAHEIMHQGSSTGNLHMLEERGQLQGQDYDEEDLYGAVIRDAPAASSKSQQQQQQQQQQASSRGASRADGGGASSASPSSSAAAPGKNVYIPPAKKQQLASQAANTDERKGANKRASNNSSNSRTQARDDEQPAAAASSSPAAATTAVAAASPAAAAAATTQVNGVAPKAASEPATPAAPEKESAKAPSEAAAPAAAATATGESTPKPAAAAAGASEPATPTASATASPSASPAASGGSADGSALKKPSKMSVKAKEFVPSSMRLSSPAFQPSYVQPRTVVMHPPPQQPLLSPDLDYNYPRPIHVVPDEQSTSPQWIPGAPYEPSSPTAMMYQPAARSPYGQQQLLPPYSFHSSPAPLPQPSRAGPPRFYPSYDAYSAAAYPPGAAQYYMVPSPPGVYQAQPIALPQQPHHHLQQHDGAKQTPPE